jgi:nitroimidazol reductase NimA-like FMN-containing flavoprotein (pyridoxamine 5'-phosphate oxidase superfamily)
MSTTMPIGEGASFLAQAHVAVLGVADADGRGPLLTPIWYHYQPGGEITILTERDSRKARLIRRAGRFSLCAQQDQPPYVYVTVEGPIIGISESVTMDERRTLARRYLGPEQGDRYVESTAAVTSDIIAFHMRPERWLTVDQGRK